MFLIILAVQLSGSKLCLELSFVVRLKDERIKGKGEACFVFLTKFGMHKHTHARLLAVLAVWYIGLISGLWVVELELFLKTWVLLPSYTQMYSIMCHLRPTYRHAISHWRMHVVSSEVKTYLIPFIPLKCSTFLIILREFQYKSFELHLAPYKNIAVCSVAVNVSLGLSHLWQMLYISWRWLEQR